jgi:ABC-type molybdate transport system substrate-binding protein
MRRMLALTTFAIILVAGCGRETVPRRGPVKRDPNLLVVYCSCALLPLVEAARDEFISANPTKSLEITSGEPLSLAQRLRDGEVPDIFICLGETEIGVLEREGHLDRSSRRSSGTLVPVIVVPQGNPAQITGPDDLLLERVRTIAVAAPGMTSIGTDAKHELERAELWSKLQDKLSVKKTALEALQAVSAGDADAAFIYDPCPRLALGDDIPPDSLSAVTPLAVAADRPGRIYAEIHKRSPNGLLAQRFLRILEDRGLTGPEAEAPETPVETEQP